ncbi:hypothetical protein [Gimesia sp.]|uniref:hypothetical protein n=1 Tax=Gimesia sp. TaxID=2024833 RepID=UPI003A91463A
MSSARQKLLKELLWSLPILLVLYVGVYITLSCLGGYFFNQSGKVRYRSMGLAVSDISTWNPKGCRFQYRFKTPGENTSAAAMIWVTCSPL